MEIRKNEEKKVDKILNRKVKKETIDIKSKQTNITIQFEIDHTWTETSQYDTIKIADVHTNGTPTTRRVSRVPTHRNEDLILRFHKLRDS